MPSATHRPDNDTLERLRAGAVELFAQRGFAATGIRDIARATGITSAAMYNYVGTKDELLAEIMRRTIEPLRDAARASIDPRSHPAEQLGNLVTLHVWWHGERRLDTLVTDTELRSLTGDLRAGVLALRDDYEVLWRTVLADGMKRDAFGLEQPGLAASALIEMCTGVAHWFRPNGVLPLADVCTLHVDWALGLVRARRGRSTVRAADLRLLDPAAVLAG